MIHKRLYTLLLLLITLPLSAQYTEIINSNRPGVSISAFSVGKNVLQGEMGFFFERQKHAGLLTESNFAGTDFAVRYGFLLEQLELAWEGVFQWEQITFTSIFPALTDNRTDFLNHTIGAKYLIYDPYKTPEKINVYSWKANNSFTWKDLIPAVSLYAGVNLNFGDNPFWPNETEPSPKATLATQHHFLSRWVLVTNITYDRFTTDDPVFNYVVTLIHALNNPKWSVFAEHQGFKSNAYADGIFRGGAAHLIHRNFQIDATVGINIKNTPSRLFGNVGFSYRLDFHKD
ncbi:MAG: transporter [Bacteroidota bacterium]